MRTRLVPALGVCLTILLAMGLLTNVARANVKPSNPTIILMPSVPSPELLDTSVTWTATLQGGQQGHTYDYQFSAALQGQNQIVRDFDLPNSFVWVPWRVEGTYVVTVVVRDITQLPYVIYPPVSQQYVIEPIATAPGQSVVNPTHHPLVALFSAGPCTLGHLIRVRFRQNGSQTTSTTNTVACATASENFLVAGMLPNTQYEMHWEEFSPNYNNSGPDVSFTTGSLPSNFPLAERMTVNIPSNQHDAAYPVVLFQLTPTIGQLFTYWPAATDLSGHILWYHPTQALMTRMEPGGVYFTMTATTISQYDLAGNLVLQTNLGIINEQMAALGYPVLTGFSVHETRILPNGNILTIGSYDQSSTQYQGGTQSNPVDILGDVILILDHNMQVVWAWDTFTHQDLSRVATLNDKCYHLAAGCPPFSQNFTSANDWTHANAVQLTADGNLLFSERSQDWVLKIDYENGHGDGHVMWRMGPYGDFTISNPSQHPCGDPNVYSWFTHQHDAAIQPAVSISEIMTVFDDGNLRHTQCGTGNSRGMILSVNERGRSVYIQTSADLGQYSVALGSAQLLPTPNNPLYASFGNGLLYLPSDASQSTETDTNGNIVYQLQANGWSYRTYRARDLYTPTLP